LPSLLGCNFLFGLQSFFFLSLFTLFFLLTLLFFLLLFGFLSLEALFFLLLLEVSPVVGLEVALHGAVLTISG